MTKLLTILLKNGPSILIFNKLRSFCMHVCHRFHFKIRTKLSTNNQFPYNSEDDIQGHGGRNVNLL